MSKKVYAMRRSNVELLDGTIGSAEAAGGDWARIVPCFYAAWRDALAKSPQGIPPIVWRD